MSKPASRRTRILSSSRALVSTNSSISGWSMSRTTIFAARRVAPPDLIVPADASAPRMKLTGPGGRAAGGEQLLRRADPRQVQPGAGATLEDQTFLAIPVKDRVHRVVDGQDEAVVHAHSAGRQVLAALGLDVVDVHLAARFDPAISRIFTGRAARPGSSNDSLQLAALTGSMNPISSAKIRRSPAF